jgi:pSer/pThr/pTyr-binding forkhead associated (FHA) protein
MSTLQLRVVTGPEQGRVIPLAPDRTYIVGRAADCDIVFDDGIVSRRHLSFTVDEQHRVLMRDLGSTGGVFVNDRRESRATIAIGDRVRIGAVYVLLVRVEE